MRKDCNRAQGSGAAGDAPFGTPALTRAFLRDVIEYDVDRALDPRRWDLIRLYYGTTLTLEDLKVVAGVRSRETVRKLIAAGLALLHERLSTHLPRKYVLSEVLRPKDAQRQAVADALRKRWQDPTYRAAAAKRSSRALKARWADPEQRERMLEANRLRWRDPALRERQRRAMAARWADPAFRQGMRATPERSEKRRAAARRRWADPDFRQRMSDAMRQRWQDPGFRARMLAAQRGAPMAERHAPPPLPAPPPLEQPRRSQERERLAAPSGRAR